MSVTSQVKRAIRSVLRRAGYDAAHISQMQDAFLHSHLAALFNSLGIDCVLDVGANVGQFRDFLRNGVGFQGVIASFEPVDKQYEVLKARKQFDKQWVVYPVALGRETRTQQMNVMKSGVFSSFLTPKHSAVREEFTKNNVVDHTELAQVRTLDSMMRELPHRVVPEKMYLKLDTQGYDLEVLAGAEETIKRIPALQTEVSIRPIYCGMPSFRESLDTFANIGFDITGLFPVTRDHLGRVIEFDCVMVNSALLENDSTR